MKCTISVIWDDEAQVWYTTSSDIPLFLNDASYDNLITRVRAAASEVLEESDNYTGAIQLVFESTRTREAMFGCLRGEYKIANDFDVPLDDFKEYME